MTTAERMQRRVKRLGAGRLLACALTLSSAGSAAASPGQVEVAYGGSGSGSVDITPTMPGDEYRRRPLAMAIGPKNEAVVLVTAWTYCASGACADLFVRRFSAGGALEPEFGERAGLLGSTESHFYAAEDRPGFDAALAVQPDGKAIVAFGDARGINLVRLNRDGSLDGAFGAGGRVLTPIGGPATISSVAVRSDGAVVVAGNVTNSGGSDLLVARYSKSGALDRSFGRGGFAVMDLGGIDLPSGIALRDGNVFLGTPECCLRRTGSLPVAEFSDAGKLSMRLDAKPPSRLLALEPLGVSAVIARRNGSIMIVGSTKEGTFVSSYLPDGELDPDFGNRGAMLIPQVFAEGGAAAIRDRQGGVVVAGWRPVGASFEGPEALTIKRVKPNGRIDPYFGGARPNLSVEENGKRVGLDLGRNIAMGVQSNGRIVVLAETPRPECIRTCIGVQRFGLVRYFGVGARKPVRCLGRVATVAGTPGDDKLTGTPGRDVIVGFAGSDTVHGGGGDDLICGGQGSDLLVGGPGEDQLRGGPGKDRVHQ